MSYYGALTASNKGLGTTSKTHWWKCFIKTWFHELQTLMFLPLKYQHLDWKSKVCFMKAEQELLIEYNVHLCASGIKQKHWTAQKMSKKGKKSKSVTVKSGVCRNHPGDCYWLFQLSWNVTWVCGVCSAASHLELNGVARVIKGTSKKYIYLPVLFNNSGHQWIAWIIYQGLSSNHNNLSFYMRLFLFSCVSASHTPSDRQPLCSIISVHSRGTYSISGH